MVAARAARESLQGATARYEPLLRLASGGMATVYVGRQVGALGFQRLVALKRPHQHLLEDAKLIRSLLAEAQLSARIQHVNVVSVRDVVREADAIYLVMDFIDGASLRELQSELEKRGRLIEPSVGLRILIDACAGLHAAHELRDEQRRPLGLVHRDVSPQNILLGLDGVARVADFGVAKCIHVRDVSTTTGTLKGKFSYMAPEYLSGDDIDRRADIFSMGIVAWELLTGERLFQGATQPESLLRLLNDEAPPPSTARKDLGTAYDAALGRALEKSPADRYDTIEQFAQALSHAALKKGPLATAGQVAELLSECFGEVLAARETLIHSRMGDDSGDAVSGIDLGAGEPAVDGSGERPTGGSPPWRLPAAAESEPRDDEAEATHTASESATRAATPMGVGRLRRRGRVVAAFVAVAVLVATLAVWAVIFRAPKAHPSRTTGSAGTATTTASSAGAEPQPGGSAKTSSPSPSAPSVPSAVASVSAVAPPSATAKRPLVPPKNSDGAGSESPGPAPNPYR